MDVGDDGSGIFPGMRRSVSGNCWRPRFHPYCRWIHQNVQLPVSSSCLTPQSDHLDQFTPPGQTPPPVFGRVGGARAAGVSLPAQDIEFPPITNWLSEEEEDRLLLIHGQKPTKTWHCTGFWINLACFCTLSVYPHVYFTCTVNVTFSRCMHSFYVLPKPLYCASIIGRLLFVCKYCTFIDIYMNVKCIPIHIYWQYDLLIFSHVSGQYSSLWYYLLSLLYTLLLLFNKHLLRNKCCFW